MLRVQYRTINKMEMVFSRGIRRVKRFLQNIIVVCLQVPYKRITASTLKTESVFNEIEGMVLCNPFFVPS